MRWRRRWPTVAAGKLSARCVSAVMLVSDPGCQQVFPPLFAVPAVAACRRVPMATAAVYCLADEVQLCAQQSPVAPGTRTARCGRWCWRIRAACQQGWTPTGSLGAATQAGRRLGPEVARWCKACETSQARRCAGEHWQQCHVLCICHIWPHATHSPTLLQNHQTVRQT